MNGLQLKKTVHGTIYFCFEKVDDPTLLFEIAKSAQSKNRMKITRNLQETDNISVF